MNTTREGSGPSFGVQYLSQRLPQSDSMAKGKPRAELAYTKLPSRAGFDRLPWTAGLVGINRCNCSLRVRDACKLAARTCLLPVHLLQGFCSCLQLLLSFSREAFLRAPSPCTACLKGYK